VRTIGLLMLMVGLLNAQFTPIPNQYGLTSTTEVTPQWPFDTYWITSADPLTLDPTIVLQPFVVAGMALGFVWNPSHLCPPNITPLIRGIPAGALISRNNGSSVWYDTSHFVPLAADAWGFLVPRVRGGTRIHFVFASVDGGDSVRWHFWEWTYDPL